MSKSQYPDSKRTPAAKAAAMTLRNARKAKRPTVPPASLVSLETLARELGAVIVK